MAEENEELKPVEVEEETVNVGGQEEELKIKEQLKQNDELRLKEQAEKAEDNEKKEASVENYPKEPDDKYNHGEYEPIKEQDISQYLWDTLLKYINKGLQKGYNWWMDSVDHALSKRDRGPAKPESSKEESITHSKERGKELYKAREDVTKEFQNRVTSEYLNSVKFNRESDKNALSNTLVRCQGIAYDVAVSEVLNEKMSKDKDGKFAKMNKTALIGEIKERVREKQEKLMSGVLATAYYAQNIENMEPSEVYKACKEYLDIRENESKAIKELITKDLENGNFVANDKKPNKDIAVKLNAFNRSFASDAGLVHSSLKEAISLVETSTLSPDEKVSLAEFQKTANLFQTFENGAALDLQRQIKLVDEAYKANKGNSVRDRIAAMKQNLGINPVASKMAQKYADNTVLRAVAKNQGGRK